MGYANLCKSRSGCFSAAVISLRLQAGAKFVFAVLSGNQTMYEKKDLAMLCPIMLQKESCHGIPTDAPVYSWPR